VSAHACWLDHIMPLLDGFGHDDIMPLGLDDAGIDCHGGNYSMKGPGGHRAVHRAAHNGRCNPRAVRGDGTPEFENSTVAAAAAAAAPAAAL
jgi:hypothetical protein